MLYWIVGFIALLVALFTWACVRAGAGRIEPQAANQQNKDERHRARILRQINRGQLRYHHSDIPAARHTHRPQGR